MIKRKNGENSPLFRIATLLLGGMFALNLLSFCVRFAGERNAYYNEYGDMQRTMEAGNYPELLDMVSRNQAMAAKTRKDTSEFQAIAKYYEAASLYHAFAEVGDTKRAARMKERMEEAGQRLVTSEFTEEAERIGRQFWVKE